MAQWGESGPTASNGRIAPLTQERSPVRLRSKTPSGGFRTRLPDPGTEGEVSRQAFFLSSFFCLLFPVFYFLFHFSVFIFLSFFCLRFSVFVFLPSFFCLSFSHPSYSTMIHGQSPDAVFGGQGLEH